MTATVAKTGKWEDTEVAAATAGYDPEKSDVSVDALVEDLGRTRRSVIGKLVSEGIYVAPEKPARKTPVDEGPSKKELLKSIDDKGFDTKGFDGSTKPALARLLELVSGK